MSKTKATLLVIVALVIGVVIGGWGAYTFMSGFMEKSLTAAEASKVTSTVTVLKSLRVENPTGAVERLEVQLDGALIGLGTFVRDLPEPPNNTLAGALASLEMARDYRIEYPRTNSSPEIEKSIVDAFSELDKYQ